MRGLTNMDVILGVDYDGQDQRSKAKMNIGKTQRDLKQLAGDSWQTAIFTMKKDITAESTGFILTG